MVLIDEHCQRTGSIAEPYECTLNQTDLKTNKNKFYIMQVIQESKSQHCLYIRYGRIGEVGRISYQNGSLEFCVNKFKTQFKSKTKNNWESRKQFVKFKDKYYLTEKQAAPPKDDQAKKIEQEAEKEKPKSKLHDRVISFLDLVGDIKMLNQTLSKLNIDTKKMPLGAISGNQLDKAENVLDRIQEAIEGKTNNHDLMDLSSEYYTYVPLVTASRTWRPPVLDTQTQLDKARENLEDLRNVKIAYSAVEQDNSKDAPKEHPADTLYGKLDTEIVPLDRNDPMWAEIEKYVYQTQGTTHHCRVKLVDIYQIGRNPDKKVLTLMGNRHLLWHGTRLSNYISILKKGLILRPELLGSNVHITGKMFGMGLYGANSFSKSFNYTYCDPGQEACLFLGEFSLGKVLHKTQSDYYLNKEVLKKQGGYHSTWGQGQWTPDGMAEINKVKVPNGKLVRSSVANACLMYDEFIVYDEKQVKLKYIVRIKSD